MQEATYDSELPRTQISYLDVEQWVSLAAGTALIAYGFSRRSFPGMALALAATPLAFRGASGVRQHFNGTNVERARAALSGDRGIHVRESIRLEQPVEEVYRFWRAFENLPRFMTHLEQVSDLGNGQSHWEARGPGGATIEWNAEIINEVENKVIGWRSLPGSDIIAAGSVNFAPVRGGRRTQLSVHLQYEPPAGRAGALFAGLLGRNPSSMIREDLRHLKQLLEAGEIPRIARDEMQEQR